MVDSIILILGIPKQKKKSAFQGKAKTSTPPPWSCELIFFAQYSLITSKLSFSQFLFFYSFFFLQLQNFGILKSVLKYQYLVNSVKTVMEITSCLYSEIPELRIEWRLLPSQWPRSSACLPTHRASTKINTLWPVPCSLSQQTPHLFPRGPD